MSDTEHDATPPPRATAVAAVNVKLPPFWPADPEVWFAQVEAQFTTRGITVQRTKFDYIVASLAPEFATEVRDLILRPPADRPYDSLREQLIKRTTASEQRKLQQLFNTEELGDRKPTQLLRRMQQLLGERAETTDSAFLRELFLQRLPGNVRMVLASTSDTTSLENLAQLADKVVEVAAPSVSAVKNSSPQLSSEVDQLRAEVTRLQEVVKSLSFKKRPRTPIRHSPTPRSSPSPTARTLCWYHSKYGDAARKCKPPCDMGSAHTIAATNTVGSTPSRLFYVTDRISGLRFLVDTGADVSVVPPLTH